MTERSSKRHLIRAICGVCLFAALGGISGFIAGWLALPPGNVGTGFTLIGIALGVLVGVKVFPIRRD